MLGTIILLDRIPSTGRIEFIDGGSVVPKADVRGKFEQTGLLSGKDTAVRDGATAVRGFIDDIPICRGERFELADVYEFEDWFAEQYPENDHIRAKIRQQCRCFETRASSSSWAMASIGFGGEMPVD